MRDSFKGGSNREISSDNERCVPEYKGVSKKFIGYSKNVELVGATVHFDTADLISKKMYSPSNGFDICDSTKSPKLQGCANFINRFNITYSEILGKKSLCSFVNGENIALDNYQLDDVSLRCSSHVDSPSFGIYELTVYNNIVVPNSFIKYDSSNRPNLVISSSKNGDFEFYETTDIGLAFHAHKNPQLKAYGDNLADFQNLKLFSENRHNLYRDIGNVSYSPQSDSDDSINVRAITRHHRNVPLESAVVMGAKDSSVLNSCNLDKQQIDDRKLDINRSQASINQSIYFDSVSLSTGSENRNSSVIDQTVRQPAISAQVMLGASKRPTRFYDSKAIDVLPTISIQSSDDNLDLWFVSGNSELSDALSRHQHELKAILKDLSIENFGMNFSENFHESRHNRESRRWTEVGNCVEFRDSPAQTEVIYSESSLDRRV